jgi:hypothetical protein
LHESAFKFLMKKNVAARAVGTDRANNPTRFSILTARVKRGLVGALNGFALNRRPGVRLDRERAASFAKKLSSIVHLLAPQFLRAINRGLARGVVQMFHFAPAMPSPGDPQAKPTIGKVLNGGEGNLRAPISAERAEACCMVPPHPQHQVILTIGAVPTEIVSNRLEFSQFAGKL